MGAEPAADRQGAPPTGHQEMIRLCSWLFPLRGTAAIGPLIAALKNGRSVTYEGREVRQRPAA